MLPELSPAVQALVRVSYGALLLATLLLALPNWKRFFVSEKWGGYAESTPSIDPLQNPAASRIVLAVWLACGGLIAAGRCTVWASAINLLLCHHFFVSSRWKSLSRGLGAPGYMCYWLGAAVFLLELASAAAPSTRSLVVLLLQIDFAMIMLSAGVSKVASGYVRNDGMELGMANPMWGYAWRWSSGLPTEHIVLKTLNHLGWSLELAAAALMLVPLPASRLAGGALIFLSFAFVATQIRLGPLCPMVMACCLLFVSGSYAVPSGGEKALVASALAAFAWTYLVLRPLVTAGLFYNLYGKKALPRPFQAVLDRLANFFGIILWRVFTADLINFYVEIFQRSRTNGAETLVSRYDDPTDFRFNNVCEAIVVTTVFTTLKYYSSNPGLFKERLLRYVRTISCPEDRLLVFRYISIVKRDGRFVHLPVTDYEVDPKAGSIVERSLSGIVDVRAKSAFSPLHEAASPGSYAPR
jgi:hypothetical protein